MPEESKIVYRKNGELSALVGKDAVQLMRVRTIISGLKMAAHGMVLTRGATATKLLKMATEYTGQTYKRTERERAIEDLETWFKTMRDALPQETEK